MTLALTPRMAPLAAGRPTPTAPTGRPGGRRYNLIQTGGHDAAIVWADSADADLASTSSNQFLIRASGGVGIGTNSPQRALHVAGAVTVGDTTNASPPAGTVRWTGSDFEGYNGTTWLSLTKPKPVFASGIGQDPWSTNRFLSPSVIVPVTRSSQQVLVTSHKAMGSVPGAGYLNLYIGYRASGSLAAPSTVGGGIFGNKVAASTRVIMGMSGVITGLAPGNYAVGLLGISSDYGNWNSNDYGYTTATVY